MMTHIMKGVLYTVGIETRSHPGEGILYTPGICGIRIDSHDEVHAYTSDCHLATCEDCIRISKMRHKAVYGRGNGTPLAACVVATGEIITVPGVLTDNQGYVSCHKCQQVHKAERFKAEGRNTPGTFYIIWSPQGEMPPKVTFKARWRADKAAKNMALAHPQQEFFVLKSKSKSVGVMPETATHETTEYFGKWRPNRHAPSEVAF